MSVKDDIFMRTALLLGEDVVKAIQSKRVIIFGVGGVGSWCAESLIRSGIKSMTIVDSDRVCASNVNRQLMATTQTIGEVKVDVLRKRLLDINPDAEVTAIQDIYDEDTASNYDLQSYDYVIDAIDSLKDKALLILETTKTDATLFSSMGAALKLDPQKIKTAEFWKVKGCPLGAALRRKFKHNKTFPSKKFTCVYSEELIKNRGENTDKEGTVNTPSQTEGPGRQDLLNHDWSTRKAQINGTLSHTTAIFGFQLAGLVIQDIYHKTIDKKSE